MSASATTTSTSTSTGERKEKPSVARSLIAGATAGAVEISITYPAEFAKTRTQLNKRLTSALPTPSTIPGQPPTPRAAPLPWPKFGREWYAGCTTLIIGNSIKAGVRFLTFDALKNALQDDDGNITGPRTVLAGLGAGIIESVVAVTPFESIKTSLIDDRKSGKPRMRGFVHGTAVILRERGPTALFAGLVPTTARQAANSATRFGVYTSLRQLAQSYVRPGEKLGAVSTFGIGAVAGIVTVYVTQPLDSVKTRMQSIEAKKEYRNSIHCAVRIVKEEGVRTLWSGAVPRLARLMMSGGIVFTMYEKSMEIFDKIDPDKKYI
ncbi:mitochondrial carrier domain-containing protein [Peziza echinospora]|nr:mitochondrial carrier domain-containing protein [Peziza echinospora]